MIKQLLTVLLILLCASPLFAATHYASPSGSASWANSTNINSPCSITTAFANASAGDLVYLRGGTYNMGSSSSSVLTTAHNGTGNSDSQRVIIKAYPGETPDIVTDVSGSWSSDTGGAINIRHNYWTLDGITMHTAIGSNEFHVPISLCYDSGCDGPVVQNSRIVVTSSGGTANKAAIIVHSTTNALIQKNDIQGYSGSSDNGIHSFYGVGTKILNNEIHGGRSAVMYKFPNCDTSLSSGAEIAYNYMYDNGRADIYGRFGHINIHDNIMDDQSGGDGAIQLGDNGGGNCSDSGAIFNHNTILGRLFIKGTGVPSMTFNNNICTGGFATDGDGIPYSIAHDYNVWGTSSLPSGGGGSNEITNHLPTFTGGSHPTTIAGFALTPSSYGYQNGSDGKDRGADVSLVGAGASPPQGTPPGPARSLDVTGVTN
jgi:hypothetical protein